LVTIRMRVLTYTLPASSKHAFDVHLLSPRPKLSRSNQFTRGLARSCAARAGSCERGAAAWDRGGVPGCPSWRRAGAAATMAAVTFLAGGLGAGYQGALRTVPTGAVYTVLLMLHVLCAVVGFGTMVVTGVQAARARRGPTAPGAPGVQRYFRPGVNWAGRALYGVPVFGFSLIEASDGVFRSGDGFVVVGLVLWLAATLLAEVVVWPGERRIQVELDRHWEEGEVSPTLDRDCRQVAVAGAVLAVLFVAATVFMVGKP